MLFQGLVRKNARRAHLSEVTAKLVFKNTVVAAAKVHPVGRCKCVEIMSAGVVFVEPYTPVTLDAPVHLVVKEWTQVLISVRSLEKPEFTISVARHDRHILKVAGTSLIAHRAVVRVIRHKPPDNILPKLDGLGIADGYPLTIRHGLHARHDKLALVILRIRVRLHSALSARANGAQCRMPTEVRQVEAQTQACLEKIFS